MTPPMYKVMSDRALTGHGHLGASMTLTEQYKVTQLMRRKKKFI
jgi:hypothetical protein